MSESKAKSKHKPKIGVTASYGTRDFTECLINAVKALSDKAAG